MEIKFYRVSFRTSSYGYYEEYLKQYQSATKAAEILNLELLPLEEKPSEDEKDSYKSRSFFANVDGDYVITKEQFLELLEAGVEVNLIQTLTQSLDKMFQTTADKMFIQGGETTYNSHCEVHMPGNMLATYNELLLLEDCCTDQVQSSLNSGWRILTVCPQNNQRRPDYILGRFNPELEIGGSAERNP